MQAVVGVEGSFEQHLTDKASIMNVPIGANLELIPVCNMDCRMCYVRTDMREVDRLGGLPDMEMWFRLGREMKELGTLFVLLTGGEPLMYPHFKEVYRYYHELGFILTVNTNGTLLTEEWADFFVVYPPRRLNITIYGQDNETYARLCGNPKGFDHLQRAIRLTRERAIPVRLSCSLTRYNYDQWNRLREIASEWEVPITSAYYMMPPGRKIAQSKEGDHPDGFFERLGEDSRAAKLQARHNESRLSPADAAEAAWEILTERMDPEEKYRYACDKLTAVDEFKPDRAYQPGYSCRAGNCSFWVKWDGSFTACGMMGDTEFNIRREDLGTLWEKLNYRTKHTCLSEKCHACRFRAICPHCAASEYTENGMFGREPEYLCRFAEEFYKVLREKQRLYALEK